MVKQLVTGSDKPNTTGGAVPADGGFFQDVSLGLNGGVLASGATFTTASTVPIISSAASSTNLLIATYGWQVPRDYDQATDKCLIRITAQMNGATDTPTLTLASSTTIMASTGVLPSGGVIGNPGSTAVSAALSSTLTVYEFNLGNQNLTRDSIISFTITAGAHTTNAVQIFAVELVYASCLVSYIDAPDFNNNPLR